MAGIKTFDDLFLHTLKDIYYAERQILKALPKMAKASDDKALADSFKLHREQTQGQVERLQQVFEAMGKRAQGVTCEAINGLIEEAEELIEESQEPGPVRDAGLIASAQAIEHYEMARYGTLIAWAQQNGKDDIVALLQQTLDEEKQTDALLTEMATTQGKNREAASKAA
jgi:ferritin-like metal-binding protein YciE